MNILRKLSTLIRAMASPRADERPASTTPEKGGDASVAPPAGAVPQARDKRADLQGQPLDRSRVADLLERQATGESAPAQRKKGDPS